ncbi:MAG: MFS transporter [Thermoflexaceae bacterium]|nr:MFS transporter [Thermoflexaceae bacterium]
MSRTSVNLQRRAALIASPASLLLVIEFFDELAFGLREAAWPAIRTDLSLSYTQVGVLLAVPGIVSAVLEPPLALFGDTGRRKALIVTGGFLVAATLLLSAGAPGFLWLLVAFSALYPASGMFVSTSQAALMEASPGDYDGAMARWTLAGSVGVVAGPLALAGAFAAGLGWRWPLAAMGVVAGVSPSWHGGTSRARPSARKKRRRWRNSRVSSPPPSGAARRGDGCRCWR